MRGRRKDPRNLCADLLKIRWKDDAGCVHREYASLEDISEGGLCLRLDLPISLDCQVTILFPKGRYEGRVKHCHFENDSHLVGIQFLPGYRWSRRQFDPAHLLQFRLRIAK